MKTIIKSAAFTALATLATVAGAECVAPVICDNVQILSIYTNAVGDTYVRRQLGTNLFDEISRTVIEEQQWVHDHWLMAHKTSKAIKRVGQI
jgi:hypothetical protein